MTDSLKNWVMVGLTLIFVVLYAAALLGWLKPLSEVTMVTRLEPIIFVIIGYYFARLPAQQNERTLKEEITRQRQKADAAQHSKEQALQARENLEEKVKNVRAILTSSSTVVDFGKFNKNAIKENSEFNNALGVGTLILAAVKILDS